MYFWRQNKNYFNLNTNEKNESDILKKSHSAQSELTNPFSANRHIFKMYQN
jgi:hypothetical protein